jgi:hypothetical protein
MISRITRYEVRGTRYKIIISVNIISIGKVRIKRSCHLGKNIPFLLAERSRLDFQITLNAAAEAANGGVYAQTADGFVIAADRMEAGFFWLSCLSMRGNRRKLRRF